MYIRNLDAFRRTLDASLHDAMSAIQASGPAACCLVEEKGAFVNIVTDGDLRRALLAGVPLSASVGVALGLKSRSPVTISAAADDAAVLAIMKRHQLRQVPLLDDRLRVVSVAVLSAAVAPVMSDVTAVIMAGGRGTRLGPLTRDCPKPMLPVAGKPMLEHIITRMIGHGVSKFLLSVNYLAHIIEDHFGSGKKLGVQIDYLHEDIPLGTAGSLALISKATTDDFIVTNGDILTSVNFTALKCFHDKSKADITICSTPYQVEVPFGVLRLDDTAVVEIIEKPTYQYQVSAGIYFVSNRVVADLPDAARLDMPELINRSHSQGVSICCFPILENWADVGTPAEYSRVASDLPGDREKSVLS